MTVVCLLKSSVVKLKQICIKDYRREWILYKIPVTSISIFFCTAVRLFSDVMVYNKL